MLQGHVGQIILLVLSCACAKNIPSKKIAIFVTLVQDKDNKSFGNDIEKIVTHSRPQTKEIDINEWSKAPDDF